MEMINAAISDRVFDHQIPSIPIKIGSKITNDSLNTNVLRSEIIAETQPLFKAVKNDEANMLIPTIMKHSVVILIACTVKIKSEVS